MSEPWIESVTVYLAGITGIWKAVPVGLALGVHPVAIALFTSLGSLTTVWIIYLSGAKLKEWIRQRYSRSRFEKRRERLLRIQNRYGIIGLGILGPGLFGPILTVIAGLMFIEKPRAMMVWLMAGIVVWSSALSLLGSLGLELTGILRP